jgi:hypothetical protein
MRVGLPAVWWVEVQNASVGTPNKTKTALTFARRDVVETHYFTAGVYPCRDRPVPFCVLEVRETGSLIPQERPLVSAYVARAYDLSAIIQACWVCVSSTRALHSDKGVTLRDGWQGLVDSRCSLMGARLPRCPPWFKHIPIQACRNTDCRDQRASGEERLESVIVTEESWHRASTPSKCPCSPETQHPELPPKSEDSTKHPRLAASG